MFQVYLDMLEKQEQWVETYRAEILSQA